MKLNVIHKKFTKKHLSNGSTLLEILLYISLFAIMSTSLISFYISITKVTENITLNIQKTEISFFVYEIIRYKVDRGEIRVLPSSASQFSNENLENIMKFYPNINISDIALKSESSSVIKVSYSIMFPHKTLSITFYIQQLHSS